MLVSAFDAAVFLTAEPRSRTEDRLEVLFRRRAQAIALVTGIVSLGGIAVLHADSARLFSHLLTRGLPLVLLSGGCGVAALLLLRRAAPRLLRVLAVVAVAAVVAGWGVAQSPYVPGTHVSIAEAAAPTATL